MIEKQFVGEFGPLKIKLIGNGNLFDRLEDEFKVSKKNTLESEFDLIIDLKKERRYLENYSSKYSSAKEHLSFNKNAFFYDQPVPFLCENLFERGVCKLTIFEKELNNLISTIKNIINTKLNSRVEISYSLLWYIMQCILLQKNYSFLHSGILEKNGKAIAFVGTGGSGKTSLLFQLLKRANYKYLSEDFGIISSIGTIQLSTKTLSIYNSDLKENPKLSKKLNKNFSPYEALKWNILIKGFKKNPMKKIPIYNFLPKPKIGKSASLEKVFFLLRSNCKSPILKKISHEELAERSVNITIREMKNLIELLSLINSNAPINYSYLKLGDFINQTKSIYKSSFKYRELYLLELPFAYSGIDTENFLILNKKL